MKKRLVITMRIPVTMTVEADEIGGDVVITDVIDVLLPSKADIDDSLDDDSISAIEEAFDSA